MRSVKLLNIKQFTIRSVFGDWGPHAAKELEFGLFFDLTLGDCRNDVVGGLSIYKRHRLCWLPDRTLP
jgi:hypothetical protein